MNQYQVLPGTQAWLLAGAFTTVGPGSSDQAGLQTQLAERDTSLARHTTEPSVPGAPLFWEQADRVRLSGLGPFSNEPRVIQQLVWRLDKPLTLVQVQPRGPMGD